MSANSKHQSGANRPPTYSRQKEKGRADRAYVWLNNKKIMLGNYGSPESRAKYAALIAEAKVVPSTPEPKGPPTVSELMAAYFNTMVTSRRCGITSSPS